MALLGSCWRDPQIEDAKTKLRKQSGKKPSACQIPTCFVSLPSLSELKRENHTIISPSAFLPLQICQFGVKPGRDSRVKEYQECPNTAGMETGAREAPFWWEKTWDPITRRSPPLTMKPSCLFESHHPPGQPAHSARSAIFKCHYRKSLNLTPTAPSGNRVMWKWITRLHTNK